MSQNSSLYSDHPHHNTIDKNNIRYLIVDGNTKLLRINPSIEGLYYRGNIGLITKTSLGIVGPRKPSTYGQKIMQHLFSILPRYDIVTISGGALGIDALVHEYSLERDIPTIVVLGGGIEYYQQSGKYHFLQKIIDNGGLVLSEYKGNMSPRKYTFPQRNRIIAGLSDVLFVPEASIGSGSLITVDKAIAYDIPVYAPMQDIFSGAGAGIAEYIRKGDIHPLDHDLGSFLGYYYAQKSGETQLFTMTNMPKNIVLGSCNDILSLEDDLISKSMNELGII